MAYEIWWDLMRFDEICVWWILYQQNRYKLHVFYWNNSCDIKVLFCPLIHCHRDLFSRLVQEAKNVPRWPWKHLRLRSSAKRHLAKKQENYEDCDKRDCTPSLWVEIVMRNDDFLELFSKGSCTQYGCWQIGTEDLSGFSQRISWWNAKSQDCYLDSRSLTQHLEGDRFFRIQVVTNGHQCIQGLEIFPGDCGYWSNLWPAIGT